MRHAFLAPSAAHRWLVCPGAPALEAQFPEESSEFAEEGTRAHAYAAAQLSTELDLIFGFDASYPPIPTHEKVKELAEALGADGVDAVNTYIGRVRELLTDAEWAGIEVPVPVGAITGEDGATGTSDCLVVKGDTLFVLDLKFGRGVKVSAEQNPQLALYALAALHSLDDKNIRHVSMEIVQPRLNNISVWAVTAETLKKKGAKLAKAAKAALALKDKPELDARDLHPDDNACRFCKAHGTCPALAAKVRQEAAAAFDNLDAVKVATIDDSKRYADALDALPLVKIWVEAVERGSLEAMKAGRKVPGWKLVAGRPGNRKWTSDSDALTAMQGAGVPPDALYSKKLITPTQCERLVKTKVLSKDAWQGIQQYVIRPEGAPSVAKADDPRPEWTAVDFKPVND
ncbi:MAG: DUF2800 domain-containing protein [Succinatimonas hippei]|nr:DUF2800 domain-containing protein [Succinatimonas hippei]